MNRLLRLRPYFMGFKFMSLQIKIGDNERPIWRISFSPVSGAQNRRSEPSRLWFSFLGPSSLRIEARFWATFRSLKIGIVWYVRLLCLIIWNKERVACCLKRYRLIEKGALTLGHLTKLIMTHDQYNLLIGGSCDCLLHQQGACGPGATSVAGQGPFRGTAFLSSLTRELS